MRFDMHPGGPLLFFKILRFMILCIVMCAERVSGFRRAFLLCSCDKTRDRAMNDNSVSSFVFLLNNFQCLRSKLWFFMYKC